MSGQVSDGGHTCDATGRTAAAAPCVGSDRARSCAAALQRTGSNTQFSCVAALPQQPLLRTSSMEVHRVSRNGLSPNPGVLSHTCSRPQTQHLRQQVQLPTGHRCPHALAHREESLRNLPAEYLPPAVQATCLPSWPPVACREFTNHPHSNRAKPSSALNLTNLGHLHQVCVHQLLHAADALLLLEVIRP